ncbi:MAG: hypothetical protein ACYS8Y_11770 [Planctomycetota bacterium]|jgi:hypothetical protein
MVRIKENWQKRLTARRADAGLLRANLTPSTFRMFACVIKMVCVKENAP